MPKIGELWAEIGARTDNLERGVARATGLLDQFGRPLQSVQTQTARLDAATKGAATSFGGFARGAGGANTAIIALSGGIQDLPYGLRGVINNVQFTAQSFTQLVGTTGSVRTAFAALGSALAGPAGILVAFSAATVALQLFTDNAGVAKTKTDELTDSLEALISVQGPEKLEFTWQTLNAAIGTTEEKIKGIESRITNLQIERGFLAAAEASRGLTAEEESQKIVLAFRIGQREKELSLAKSALAELQSQRSQLESQVEAFRILDEAGGKRLEKERKITEEIEKQARLTTSFRPGAVSSARVGFGAGEVRPVTTPRVGLLGQDIVGAPSIAGLQGLTDTFNAMQLVGDRMADVADAAGNVETATIEVENKFKELTKDTLRHFSFALGDAIANVVLFGDSLKETLGNIGKRAAGSFLGGLVNFGVSALLDEIPGFSTAKKAATTAYQGLTQNRPDTSQAFNSLSARISLNDLVIEQQRTATRNNLNLVGLS